MDYHERDAVVLYDVILNAVVRPSLHGYITLGLLKGEITERYEMVRDEGQESDKPELYILGAFITYLEALIEQRQPKED